MRINTLVEGTFRLPFTGVFKCFDNHNKDNRVVLNGQVDYGEGRDRENLYFRKFCLQHNEKFILIDCGYRGEYCKIIACNKIDFVTKKEEIFKNVRRKCDNCDFVTFDNKHSSHNFEGHKLRDAKRNLIEVTIRADNVYKFKFYNVDFNNKNPGFIEIDLKIKNKIDCYSGCMVKRPRNIKNVVIDNLFRII